METELNFGKVNVYWKPKMFSQLIRFLKYTKFKSQAYKQFYDGLEFRHANQERMNSNNNSEDSQFFSPQDL